MLFYLPFISCFVLTFTDKTKYNIGRNSSMVRISVCDTEDNGSSPFFYPNRGCWNW